MPHLRYCITHGAEQKAKIDTGARTSALHTFQMEIFKEKGVKKVRFGIHPLQKRKHPIIYCVADVVDYRRVIDSGGHAEMRYVIKTPVQIGSLIQDVEITLTDRETMQFRMLLGRTAMTGLFQVDPGASYLAGRALGKVYRQGSTPKKAAQKGNK